MNFRTLSLATAAAVVSLLGCQRKTVAIDGVPSTPLVDPAAKSRAQETSRLSAPVIAARVGLGSAESLRHHFRRRVGTTPAQYRRRFSRR